MTRAVTEQKKAGTTVAGAGQSSSSSSAKAWCEMVDNPAHNIEEPSNNNNNDNNDGSSSSSTAKAGAGGGGGGGGGSEEGNAANTNTNTNNTTTATNSSWPSLSPTQQMDAGADLSERQRSNRAALADSSLDRDSLLSTPLEDLVRLWPSKGETGDCPLCISFKVRTPSQTPLPPSTALYLSHFSLFALN